MKTIALGRYLGPLEVNKLDPWYNFGCTYFIIHHIFCFNIFLYDGREVISKHANQILFSIKKRCCESNFYSPLLRKLAWEINLKKKKKKTKNIFYLNRQEVKLIVVPFLITQNIEVKIGVKNIGGFQYNWVEHRLFIRENEWKSIQLEIDNYKYIHMYNIYNYT